jgi:hypothetical protein
MARKRSSRRVADARAYLKVWRDEESPLRAPTSRTAGLLRRLIAALPAPGDDFHAYTVISSAVRPRTIPEIRRALEASAAKARVNRTQEPAYVLAMELLVQAWEEERGCSPLTRFGEFQTWFRAVTKGADVPAPSERTVRQILRALRQPPRRPDLGLLDPGLK